YANRNKLRPLPTLKSCLGMVVRDSGHKRVPLPPAMITAYRMGGKPTSVAVQSSGVTPASLLAAALDANPSRPLFTFYDDATGERVELSVASFENWVAKTANLLRNGLDAQPGERIAVRLPAHWQGAVWMLAAWS